MVKIPPKSKLVFLDFETFYDKKAKYSLRTQKFSMTQYIRDDRFKVHSVSIRKGRMKKAICYTNPKSIKRALAAIDWKTSALVAHNAAFDGLILSHHFGHVPLFYICTMSMARPLHGHSIGAGLDEVAKYYGLAGKQHVGALDELDGVREPSKEQLGHLALYNNDDVDDMFEIYFKMVDQLPEDEMLLIHHTIKAYADPVVEVNRELARKEWEKEKADRRSKVLEIAPLIQTIYDFHCDNDTLDDLPYARNKPSKKNPLGTPKKGEVELWEPSDDTEVQYERLLKILSSSDKLGFVFRSIGHPLPTKWSEAQEKDIPALALGDLEFQALAEHPNEYVKQLYVARVAAKSDMAEQRAWRLLEHSKDGNKLPLMLNYAKAHTLRWTGGDLMNPQNFPRGSNLRKSLVAPPGHKINVVDSGQIEARTNALVAGQLELLEQFRDYDENVEKYGKDSIEAKSRDPYRVLAGKIYNIPPEATDGMQRFVGKIGVLGLGYQMGAAKYQNTLAVGAMGPPVEISLQEAKHVVDTYRGTNYAIKQFWDFLQNHALPALHGSGPAVGWDFNEGAGQLWFEKGEVHLPNGMVLFYKGMERSKGQYGWEYRYKSSSYEWSHIYGGLLCENIIQCLARLIVGEQVIVIGDNYRILTLTHDECVFLSRNRSARKAQRIGEAAFAVSKDWYINLPLKGEGGFDDCYSK